MCGMYYMVHSLDNLSKVAIHIGTHAHPAVEGKCKEFIDK
jgi:hypothetical protein